jgi:nitroimidazol reductase NimA-like FMN-containing flavoprotein (pyridoxamine 5'-phosphate oxidase superfamily)
MRKILAPSERTKVRRIPDRGSYDREVIDRILDEAVVCQVGIVEAGQPVVIPMAYARLGDSIYVHGSKGSRLLRTLASGAPACISVTLVDGLVLARSAFHHSMNYRSVVVFGSGRAVEDPAEKTQAFQALLDRLVPGRWQAIRGPNDKELQQTLVAAISLEEASAKIRTGPPKDDEEDLDFPVWAGVLPLRLEALAPIPDAHLKNGLQPPVFQRRGVPDALVGASVDLSPAKVRNQ